MSMASKREAVSKDLYSTPMASIDGVQPFSPAIHTLLGIVFILKTIPK